jgi:osmotically-inducible protein OsmY
LQKDVQDAIKWEPLLKAAEIGVSVNDGIVTLSGTVDSFLKKSEAEDAAKGVAGVKAVVEKIDINFGTWGVTADSQIAAAVLNAIKWNWDVPGEKIKIRVEKGWVTLEGELEWNYQRDTAKTVVSRLNAVKGVSNNITIKSESFDEIEKRDIEHALARNWSLNDREIRVKVSGSTVTLSGLVDSLYQKDRAGKIAWNAPGVRSVDNELVVEYSDTMVE